MNRKETVAFIEKHKAVAVIRLPEASLFEPVAEALYEGGVKILEITMTVPDALSLIRKAVKNAPDDMLVGVGSVLDADTARQSIEAGAAFVVSPILKEEVIRTAHDFDTAVMPGAFTPTEAQTAWEWGADVVKIFPADVVGMGFFKGVKAPMPHLKLMPTGGVSLDNAREWIQAGASAVGLGSALVDKESVKNRNFEQIRQNAVKLMNHLNQK
ncbi:MAG: bifunctional 4-hydroxy-2-oxoglutarate aldolase/2-dehydro-3-deoxy-phosphogluconate aldolase [Balneolaceae bacterium]